MQHEKKNFVYLHRLNLKHVATNVVRNAQRFGLLLCPTRCRYTTAVCEPRDLPVIGTSATCVGLSSGKWHAAFFVPRCLTTHIMTHSRKTTGRDPQSITFKADWLDFTEHLSNAQVGRLLRCVARYERGDINPQHVAELRKDAAVGVAYNFITEQLERRSR